MWRPRWHGRHPLMAKGGARPKTSSHGLELDPARFADPLGSLQDLQRDEVPVFVVVENDARLVLIALDDRSIRSQDDVQRIGSRVISGFHGYALLYMSENARPVSTNISSRSALPANGCSIPT